MGRGARAAAARPVAGGRGGVASLVGAASLAATVFVLVLISVGCGGLSDGRTDPAAGGRAARIVSLAPSVTEILFAIGAGDSLVGVCTSCDYPPAVASVPRVGTFTTPSIEAIVAARPDLVIAARGPATMGALASVRRVGFPVLIVDDTTIAAVWKAIADIGRRTGRREAAASLAKRLADRLRAVRERLAGLRRRRVLVVVGQTPLVVAGGGTFVNEIIEVAGGVNVARDTRQPWPRLSMETVLARAPEVIIDTALGHEHGADPRLWSRFPTLPAVRHGRVHVYRSLVALRGGPRLAEAAEEFARMIHPGEYERDAPGTPSGGGQPAAATARASGEAAR